MIIEGLVTTTGPGGEPHVAPMGPDCDEGFTRLLLKPFGSSLTLKNLKARPEGVFHVLDDAELVAQAALGSAAPSLRPAERVRGWVVLEACRYFEFRVGRIDESRDRAELECQVVASGSLRDFQGFNRARHAVLEAAILATRAGFLPLDRLRAQMAELGVPVEKTGGPREKSAFRLLLEHVERTAAARAGGAPPAVQVSGGSRLHFGLLLPAPEGPAPGGSRRFGAVGAMVREPGIELVARPAPSPSASGLLSERAGELARRLARAPGLRPVAVEVRRAPQLHAGLGTGTQLGMAMARAAAELSGTPALGAAELASLAGRGERSAVGLHGFVSGGLLVDGGRSASAGPAPLVARAEIPAHWRFLLLAPPGEAAPRAGFRSGLAGEAEREAFRRLEAAPALSARMAQAVLLGLLPAAQESDLRAFGEALGEVERLTGECFAPVQGGPYASREIEEVVRFIQREGVPGVGQSSWGPSVYAILGSEEAARALSRAVLAAFPRLGLEPIITPPLNTGARVEPAPAAAAADRLL